MIERMRVQESAKDSSRSAGSPRYASQVHGDGAPVPAAEPSAGASAKGPGKWYWVRWSSLMVFMGLVTGGVLVVTLKFVDGPISATATFDSLEAARASVQPKPETNMLGGSMIELAYPSVFDTVTNRSKEAGAGDQYYISSKGSSSRTMVVTVFGLASRQLSDDSSYKFRSMHPELYKETTVKLGTEQAVIMTKTDNTEVVLFWLHGGKDLNIALTSTDPHDNLPEYIRTIIPTIRWKL